LPNREIPEMQFEKASLRLSGAIPFGIAVACAASSAPCMAADEASGQTGSPFRYDDVHAPPDPGNEQGFFDRLKYLPLEAISASYLSFGGDLRERFETSNVSLLGLKGGSDQTYLLHRLLAFGDLHLGTWRVFMQMGNELESGRQGGAVPTDIDRGDIAQAFVDYGFAVQSAELTLRAGRFEMSFDDGALIGLRDGPNVRQSWDGFRAIAALSSANLDIFAVRPVAVRPGFLDDGDVAGQSLFGIHSDLAIPGSGASHVNAFYYVSLMPQLALFPKPGPERSQTLGARWRTTIEAWDGSFGAMRQFGTFADEPISAWSVHADVGRSLVAFDSRPHLALRVDALSGGDNRHGTVRTFNALYPNYAFSTEATIEAPENLTQAALALGITPLRGAAVEYKFEGLWRTSESDAFYAAPTFPAARPAPAGGRFTGTEQQLRGSYQIGPVWTVTGAFVRFEPATFLRSQRSVAENFAMAELSARF
jgi:hypothetical protein